MRHQFSRWDGTQDPFGDSLEVGDILEEISDDLLSGISPRRALRRLMHRGIPGRADGMDELRRRLLERRRQIENAMNLQGPLQEIRDRLDEILSAERAALAERGGRDAAERENFLDSLPASAASSIKELMDYRFADRGAQQRFDELVEDIQKQVLSSYFGQMMGAMSSVTPDDVARMRRMVAELNQMIAARESGRPYDFEGFMQRFGDFFPENPRNLDELLETLGRRMAAMSRLLASLSREQRAQLAELADAVMADLDLAFEMDMLGQELRCLMPALPWDEAAYGMSDEPMSMPESVGALAELGDLEQLEEALAGRYSGATIDDVDEEKLRKALGENAVGDLRRLKEIEKTLEQAGVVAKDRGNLELTARGIRRLGERALVKVFETLDHDRDGSHPDRRPGGPAEATGATRPWRFGDTGEISVQRSLFNAVIRNGAGQKGRRSSGVRLRPEDFELVEAESRTATATALLIDLSSSMNLRGHWVPAARMALALATLIESKYPEDKLFLVGFSDYARRLDLREITGSLGGDRVQGTNMQHAFLLAGRLLAEYPRARRQVIMVTDGEPTAHLEDAPRKQFGFGGPGGLTELEELIGPEELRKLLGGGSWGPGEPERTEGPYSFFSWPPLPETINKTLAEAARLSNSGITLNIFMLEEDPGLTGFMERLARRTKGRVFQAAGADIGNFVLRDFVARR